MRKLRDRLLELSGLRRIARQLDNQFERDVFVRAQLGGLPDGSLILDAGCGSQRYRRDCSRLTYKAQDFGQYTTDERQALGSSGVGGETGYVYGELDYLGNIWEIDERAETFDAILCTEVLEHIPYPGETIREFSRLLKAGGTLILTAPSNCLRHMDPYFFYSGFSDRWFEALLKKHGLEIEKLEPVGDYYSWLAVEMVRTAMAHSPLAKLVLFPAFVYFFTKRKTKVSTDTLCMGYHVLARKAA